MRSLFLQPHPDDAVLFGTFTLFAERPDVVTVLYPDGQRQHGVEPNVRILEDFDAMRVLGLQSQHIGWPFPETDPTWPEVEKALGGMTGYGRVYAPAVEDGGHDHHNRVGEIARRVFGSTRVVHYLTYTRHGGKSRGISSACEPYLERCRFESRAVPDAPGMEGAYCLTHHQFHDATFHRPGVEVVPPSPEAVTLKLRAMACYRSQIETPEAGCQAHFVRDLTEWRIP